MANSDRVENLLRLLPVKPALSKRMSVLATTFADDFGEDDDMLEEWERLQTAQTKLHRELSEAVKLVGMMQSLGEEEYDDDNDDKSLNLEDVASGLEETGNRSFPSVASGSNRSLRVEEEAPTRRRTFAAGFFEFIKPKETLERQKKKQMALLMLNMDSESKNIMQCRNDTQGLLILQKKQELESTQEE